MTTTPSEPQVAPFTPQNKDIVYVLDPDDPKAPHTMAFVVRRATWKDKVDFILRLMRMGEKMDKKALRTYFKDDKRFLCFEDDELVILHLNVIAGLAHRSGDEEVSEVTESGSSQDPG